nr:hypothetical protein [Candidatus Neomarinimicrobiota bacterium]
LLFNSHGSGLELGYGTREENRLTLDYRENYIDRARLTTWDVLARSMLRLSIPEESLASEAILVYNPLAFKTAAVIEITYPSIFSQPAQVIDLSTGKIIPSYNQISSLYFRSDDLPALGYKKFQLIRNPASDIVPFDTDLEIGAYYIANAKYKITVNAQNGEITSVFDRLEQRELFSNMTEISFSEPVMFKPYQNDRITALNSENVEISIIDQRPVNVHIEIIRPDHLFSRSRYSLSSGGDQIEVLHTLNLDQLNEPEFLEEYGVSFPVNLKRQHIALDLAGGFVTEESDILPGAQTGYYSIRRGFALYDDNYTINIGLVDGRIVKTKLNGNTVKAVTTLLVNNFPVAWNRSEKNEGSLDFHFVITSAPGSFDPGQFVQCINPLFNNPVPLRTWLRIEPGEVSYFSISDPRIQIVVIAPSSSDEGFIVRLHNSDHRERVAGELRSPFFNGRTASRVSIWENKIRDLKVERDLITISFGANEIQTILIEPLSKKKSLFHK